MLVGNVCCYLLPINVFHQFIKLLSSSIMFLLAMFLSGFACRLLKCTLYRFILAIHKIMASMPIKGVKPKGQVT